MKTNGKLQNTETLKKLIAILRDKVDEKVYKIPLNKHEESEFFIDEVKNNLEEKDNAEHLGKIFELIKDTLTESVFKSIKDIVVKIVNNYKEKQVVNKEDLEAFEKLFKEEITKKRNDCLNKNFF